MKYSILFFLLLCGWSTYSQSSLNAYKYVIVPKQFDGFRSENQYDTSTLVKYYLGQAGLDPVYEDALPQDLNVDRCLGLKAELMDSSSMFATTVHIVFMDCKGQEVYRTREGTSKIKEYREAFREAIAEAFQSLNGYNYAYRPKSIEEKPLTPDFKDDVKNLDPDVIVTAVPEVNEIKVPKTVSDKEEEKISGEKPLLITMGEVKGVILYAQRTGNGYQLVDTTPSIQYVLKDASIPGVYFTEGKGQVGLIFQKGDQWIFEYYKGEERFQEFLQIKF